MPYASDAQRRFFHTPTGMAKIGPEKVAEFDQASKGMKLPARAPASAKAPAGSPAKASAAAGKPVNYGAMVNRAKSY